MIHLFTPGSDHVAQVAQNIKGLTGEDLQVSQPLHIITTAT